MDDTPREREIWCSVVGHSDISAAIRIRASNRDEVQDLKEKICEKGKERFDGLDASHLVLWKLLAPTSEDFAPPSDDGKLSEIAVELDPAAEVSILSFSDKGVQIIVQKRPLVRVKGTQGKQPPHHIYGPPPYHIYYEPPPKHIYGPPDAKFAQLYDLFWGVPTPSCYITIDPPIPDLSEPQATAQGNPYTAIRLDQPLFPFGGSRLLVTHIYRTFLDLLEKQDKIWQNLKSPEPFRSASHATIISGQPGIGKQVFLSYVLVSRLQRQLDTVYCDDPGYAHVFTKGGVEKVYLTPYTRIRELDTDSKCCALVNLGVDLERPPSQFKSQIRRGRLVVATPPNPEHTRFAKEHPAQTYWMPTWGWRDLYCSSLLCTMKEDLSTVDTAHYESLKDAYTKLSGVPQHCFRALSPSGPDALRQQIHEIERAIDAIDNINDLPRFVSSMQGYLPFRATDSHTLVRVEPAVDTGGGDLEWAYARRASVVMSEFVGGLVLERMRMRRYDSEKVRIGGSVALGPRAIATSSTSLERPRVGWYPL
ncbi:hypothetical protein BOTBODRAFT_181501 [Botryobasidium botryosum FD-172 SS1]|uniref:Crinkler effector protein N-terminal domain-containing protein n=1 Tax=Botryobasidium botryosum (strain FD-172 SS1) TaxID=930990 RepID=A0A067M4M5_BOTB1|nr:hypothetical protein BOTBODRAFT_181501 [Botryobasidium botryosum FD-172 SS1]